MKTIQREIVGAVIVSSDDYILLGEAATHLGQLCIPGGGLLDGETPQQGVIREVSEETGLVLLESALIRVDDPISPRIETRPKVLRDTGENVMV